MSNKKDTVIDFKGQQQAYPHHLDNSSNWPTVSTSLLLIH